MDEKRIRQAGILLAVAAIYFGATLAGFPLSFKGGNTWTIWPASGIGLAALLLGGGWLWPAILIGDIAARSVHGSELPVTLAVSVGQTLESVVGYWLLTRVGFDRGLNRTRDVLALAAFGALVPTAIAATIGAVTFAIAGLTPWSGFWSNWHLWWLADADGVIIVVPLAFAYLPSVWNWLRGMRWPGNWNALELVAWVGVLVMVVLGTAGLTIELGVLIFPALVWGALRFGNRGATLAIVIAAVAALLVLNDQHSIVQGVSLDNELLFTQMFLLMLGTTALLFAAVREETATTVEQLRASEHAATALASEHASVGRIATAVAEDTPPGDVFELVSAEAAHLLDQPQVVVIHGTTPENSTVVGGWSADDSPPRTAAQVSASGIGAAISVDGVEWGRLQAPQMDPSADPDQTRLAEASLSRLAGLLGQAIANHEDRRQLLHWATTDPLTGLANHRAFHERLAAEMARFRRYGHPVAVAMLDIDRFKQVNDTAGHLIGDSVLATVSRRITSVMRADALVARVGGDELGVILPECNAETAVKVVNRAREAVAAQPIVGMQSLTMSAGICDSAHARTPDQILGLADQALYHAKSHGRNGCVSYSGEVSADVT